MTEKNESAEEHTEQPEEQTEQPEEEAANPADALTEALKVINEQKKQLEQSAERTQELTDQIAVMLRNGQGVTGADPNIRKVDEKQENVDNGGNDYVSLADLGAEMGLKH